MKKKSKITETRQEERAPTDGHRLLQIHEENNKERKTRTSSTSIKTPKDVWQSQQYEFDKSSVPSDDDIEIIDVIPAPEQPKTPFITSFPEIEEIQEIVKQEPNSTVDLDNSREDKANEQKLPQPSPKVEEEDFCKCDDDDHGKPPAESHAESHAEPSERESMLMQQVQELSKGLDEMKAIMDRNKKNTLVAKLKKKFKKRPKIKITTRKRKQEKVDKPMKLSKKSKVIESKDNASEPVDLVTSTKKIEKEESTAVSDSTRKEEKATVTIGSVAQTDSMTLSEEPKKAHVDDDGPSEDTNNEDLEMDEAENSLKETQKVEVI